MTKTPPPSQDRPGTHPQTGPVTSGLVPGSAQKHAIKCSAGSRNT